MEGIFGIPLSLIYIVETSILLLDEQEDTIMTVTDVRSRLDRIRDELNELGDYL